MQATELAERLAKGNRIQTLNAGERPVNSNRLFRIWTDHGTRVLKVYGTAARERRERHALTALRGVVGIPSILDRGTDGDVPWAVFEDAGRWNLSTLPENPTVARNAGQVLRRIHDTAPEAMSNLARGIDQEWVALDFVSTFRRLERYRGRLSMSADILEAARTVRPPFASDPASSHTDPSPENFVVDDAGTVTLVNWEWATLAPPEWDLAKAMWLIGLRSGPAAAEAFAEGYGRDVDRSQLDRWTVYHAGMMLVYEAEARISGGRLDDLGYLVAELQRAIAGARNSAR